MSHKTVVKVAIVMAIVFAFIVIVYPTIFGPSDVEPIEPMPDAAVPAAPAVPGQ